MLKALKMLWRWLFEEGSPSWGSETTRIGTTLSSALMKGIAFEKTSAPEQDTTVTCRVVFDEAESVPLEMATGDPTPEKKGVGGAATSSGMPAGVKVTQLGKGWIRVEQERTETKEVAGTPSNQEKGSTPTEGATPGGSGSDQPLSPGGSSDGPECKIDYSLLTVSGDKAIVDRKDGGLAYYSASVVRRFQRLAGDLANGNVRIGKERDTLLAAIEKVQQRAITEGHGYVDRITQLRSLLARRSDEYESAKKRQEETYADLVKQRDRANEAERRLTLSEKKILEVAGERERLRKTVKDLEEVVRENLLDRGSEEERIKRVSRRVANLYASLELDLVRVQKTAVTEILSLLPKEGEERERRDETAEANAATSPDPTDPRDTGDAPVGTDRTGPVGSEGVLRPGDGPDESKPQADNEAAAEPLKGSEIFKSVTLRDLLIKSRNTRHGTDSKK